VNEGRHKRVYNGSMYFFKLCFVCVKIMSEKSGVWYHSRNEIHSETVSSSVIWKTGHLGNLDAHRRAGLVDIQSHVLSDSCGLDFEGFGVRFQAGAEIFLFTGCEGYPKLLSVGTRGSFTGMP
jgi:hypothetical protein